LIDGHGHTISGINVTRGDANGSNMGLFGNYLQPIDGSTVGVKNLTITESFVRGNTGSGGLFGKINAGAGEVLFENLVLDMSMYVNSTEGGMIAGISNASNVTVENVVAKGTRQTTKNKNI
jgi:hypothetical protein